MSDLFGEFFAFAPQPPESVARKVLGIGTSQPLVREGIVAAFRFRVRLLRPDLSDEMTDRLRLRDLADGERVEIGSVQSMRFDSGSKQEQLAELLWAREDLLRRVPKLVTASKLRMGESFTRNTPEPICADCGKVGGRGWERGRLRGLCYACGRKKRLAEARERRLRARANRSCESCGAVFTRSRSDARYCSSACRQRAYRGRTLGVDVSARLDARVAVGGGSERLSSTGATT